MKVLASLRRALAGLRRKEDPHAWLDLDRLRPRLRSLSSLGYRVPYADYQARHRFFSEELGDELERVFSLRTDAQRDDYLETFAGAFARRLGLPYGVGVSSGTTALTFALLASGLQEGDEVLTSCWSYVATGLAIRDAGGVPVFVDVAPGTPHLDAAALARARTPRTHALLVPHLFGSMADPAPLKDFCAREGLLFIEDACQAHEVRWDQTPAGAFGSAAGFSFNFTKLLSGPGNGGIMVTRDRAVYERARALRDPEAADPLLRRGRRTPAYLDTVQAAFVRAQLRGAGRLLEHHRHLDAAYRVGLASLPVAVPPRPERAADSGYALVIRAPRRDALRDFLLGAGVEARAPFSGPLSRLPVFSDLDGRDRDFPQTQRLSREALSLPIGVHLDERAVEETVRLIAQFYGA